GKWRGNRVLPGPGTHSSGIVICDWVVTIWCPMGKAIGAVCICGGFVCNTELCGKRVLVSNNDVFEAANDNPFCSALRSSKHSEEMFQLLVGAMVGQRRSD